MESSRIEEEMQGYVSIGNVEVPRFNGLLPIGRQKRATEKDNEHYKRQNYGFSEIRSGGENRQVLEKADVWRDVLLLESLACRLGEQYQIIPAVCC